MNARREFIKYNVAAAAALGSASSAFAQKKPLGQVRLVVGFPAGSSTDLMARALADFMQGKYAETILVENKSGAGGRIGLDYVKKAAPDGTTLTIVPNALITLYPHTYSKLTYSPDDFAPVAVMGRFTFALIIGPAVPAAVKSPADLVDWIKKQPGQSVNITGNSQGAPGHVLGLAFAKRHGFNVNYVPYRSGTDAVQAVMSGDVPLAVVSENLALAFAASGRLRVLATAGEQRSYKQPGVPTFRELGLPELTQEEWVGMYAPKGTPQAIIEELFKQWKAAAETDRIKEMFAAGAATISTTEGPIQAAALIKSDLAHFGQMVRASGLKFED